MTEEDKAELGLKGLTPARTVARLRRPPLISNECEANEAQPILPNEWAGSQSNTLPIDDRVRVLNRAPSLPMKAKARTGS